MKTKQVPSREVQTLTDFDDIVSAEGFSVAYPTAAEMALLTKMKMFVQGLKLAFRASDQQQWMFEGLLHDAQEIAKAGYRTSYAVYLTEEKKRGCWITFYPVHQYEEYIEVPLHFDDLMSLGHRPVVGHC
jgi:hypothetical protein